MLIYGLPTRFNTDPIFFIVHPLALKVVVVCFCGACHCHQPDEGDDPNGNSFCPYHNRLLIVILYYFNCFFSFFVIQSVSEESFPFRGGIPHCVRNDKGTSKSIIHSGFQPSAEGLPCFPNAAHWAELTRPFRALTAVSIQPSAPHSPFEGGAGGMFISTS